MAVQVITMVCFFAFVVERIVEWLFATPLEVMKGEDWKYRRILLPICSLFLAIPTVYFAQVDIIKAFAEQTNYTLPQGWGQMGIILTGVIVAGGSNLITDIKGKFLGATSIPRVF